MTREAALKHIKYAWLAGLFVAGITLLFIVVSVLGLPLFAELGFDLWGLLDVALILGLSYGVYRKSRICAVLLFAYFVLDKIYSWHTLNVVVRYLLILFVYLFFQGIRGTFASLGQSWSSY